MTPIKLSALTCTQQVEVPFINQSSKDGAHTPGPETCVQYDGDATLCRMDHGVWRDVSPSLLPAAMCSVCREREVRSVSEALGQLLSSESHCDLPLGEVSWGAGWRGTT